MMGMNKAETSYIADIKELRNIQLGALNALVDFCKAQGLTYYMTGGTLLGAVRHKGFIPWDDDIDIVMPRPDYEKLLSLSKGILSEHYRVMSFERDVNHCRLYYRVVDSRTGYQDQFYGKRYESSMGIDVFPIDGVPKEEKERDKYFARIKTLRQRFIYSVSAPFKGTSPIRALLKTFVMLPYKLVGSKTYYKRIQSLVKKFPYEDSDMVALVIGYYNSKELLYKEQYGTPVMLPFEGNLYAAPEDYKQYLTNLYGDYMKLPPKEQQRPHHSFTAWYK